ncbi:unnamed protein product [Paramecium primaurelia]|uniref:Uncharacterized protein n=1 Tax=Paramecium primaurelia TaxID=5886 RepID=A0A8S1NE51_PARPR|nr:unnamed protein product [Paramecium primaurelia]
MRNDRHIKLVFMVFDQAQKQVIKRILNSKLRLLNKNILIEFMKEMNDLIKVINFNKSSMRNHIVYGFNLWQICMSSRKCQYRSLNLRFKKEFEEK